MTFHERKRLRTEYFEKYEKGNRMVTCSACNGSGVYDHHGGRKCECCNGKGKTFKIMKPWIKEY